ncbi:MAG: TRAP-type mannitol/chloroaromatic compound transport system substrate-binding protein [Candidatus Pseudothioglobus sp.]|jgi:TRAP-type mannitol/chloroaromatic compound transport system substrate-binding protein
MLTFSVLNKAKSVYSASAVIFLVAISLVGCADKRATEPTLRAANGAVTNPAKIFKWRLVTTWPKNLPGVGTGPERMADAIREMSAGRLDITVYGGGEVVPALGVFDAVSLGNVEMGHGAAYYWKGKLPAAQFFTNVPFGLTAQEMNGWLQHGGGMALWEELYAPYDLIPMAGGNTGVQMAGWFNKEINSLDDLRGVKMRIPGMGGEVFERAGGTAINIAAGEIFTSLQTGNIDAAEWVGPYNDLSFGLYQAARYYYYPGWQEPGPVLEVIVNKNAMETLPKDLQAILRSAAAAMNADMLAEYTARSDAALAELVNNHQVQLRRLPDDVLARLQEISIEMVQEIAGDDALAQRIYQSYETYRQQVTHYSEISERAYINARAGQKTQ